VGRDDRRTLIEEGAAAVAERNEHGLADEQLAGGIPRNKRSFKLPLRERRAPKTIHGSPTHFHVVRSLCQLPHEPPGRARSVHLALREQQASPQLVQPHFCVRVSLHVFRGVQQPINQIYAPPRHRIQSLVHHQICRAVPTVASHRICIHGRAGNSQQFFRHRARS